MTSWKVELKRKTVHRKEAPPVLLDFGSRLKVPEVEENERRQKAEREREVGGERERESSQNSIRRHETSAEAALASDVRVL